MIGQRGDRVYRQKEQSLTNEKSLVSVGWEEGVQERREKECNGIIMKDDTLVDIAAQSAMAILAEIFSSYQSGRSPGGLLMIFLLHGPKMLSHSYS